MPEGLLRHPQPRLPRPLRCPDAKWRFFCVIQIADQLWRAWAGLRCYVFWRLSQDA
jgi:hypothetical protein